MELNLDRLNSLSFADFPTEKPKKQAPEKPQETLLRQEEYKTPPQAEKPAEGLIEGMGALQLRADAIRLENSRSLEICKEYQENIKKSSQLQTELLKGVQAGEDIYTLFLKATEALSKLINNSLFYEQIERDIKSVYGRGLQEPAPLRLELVEVNTRLTKLREAERRETDYNSLERIRVAIKAHESRIAELENSIARAEERPA